MGPIRKRCCSVSGGNARSASDLARDSSSATLCRFGILGRRGGRQRIGDRRRQQAQQPVTIFWRSFHDARHLASSVPCRLPPIGRRRGPSGNILPRALRRYPNSAVLRGKRPWHSSCLVSRGRRSIRMFDNIFGIHEQALLLHGQRLGVLATNLANADTPNYKARDIDFSEMLAHSGEASIPLRVTQAAHITASDGRTAGRRLEVPQSLPGFARRQHRGNAGGAGGLFGEQRPLSGEPDLHQSENRRDAARHSRSVAAIKEHPCHYSMYSMSPAAR